MSDRFGVIDPSALGIMSVIDVPSADKILADRMAAFKARWAASDPDYGALYDTENIRFDPARVANQVGTSYEVNIRSRVNQAARDTTLAFGFGSNLDGIASKYPGGVPRLPIVNNPRPYATAQEDWESDSRYRRRIWLAANAFTTAGSQEAYEFWGMTAAPTLRDVSATVVKTLDGPVVVITCLGPNPADPTPSAAEFLAVRKVMQRRDVKPLTDIVTVRGPGVIDTEYLAYVNLYPGPDSSSVQAVLDKRLAEYLEGARYLGHDHTQLAYSGLLNIDAVTHSARLAAPAKDLLVGDRQYVRVIGTPKIIINPKRLV